MNIVMYVFRLRIFRLMNILTHVLMNIHVLTRVVG